MGAEYWMMVLVSFFHWVRAEMSSPIAFGQLVLNKGKFSVMPLFFELLP
jgi:hypothetical protein